MNPTRRQNPINRSVTGSKNGQSLSDQRYQDLLKSASAFFTSAEESTEERRQTVIDEIKEQMSRHGLTIDDLLS